MCGSQSLARRTFAAATVRPWVRGTTQDVEMVRQLGSGPRRADQAKGANLRPLEYVKDGVGFTQPTER